MRNDSISDVSYKATQKALAMWKSMLTLSEKDKYQLLFDTSTFECNKPIISWMLSQLAPDKFDWSDIDHRSDRRNNILFQPGTMIRFNHFHDSHDYPVPSLAMVYRIEERQNRHGKKYTVAINEDGKLGSLLYVYNPFYPAFEPADVSKKDIEKWIERCKKVSMNARPAYAGTFNSYIESIIYRKDTNGEI